jgi:cell division protein ZapA (FtsZ GTPase activity inhibitor)
LGEVRSLVWEVTSGGRRIVTDTLNNQGRTIRVEIFDRAYQLSSAADEKYTRQLAKSVDDTMHHIAEKTETVESLRVAVLAALHFADRYERLKERYDKLNGLISEKSARLREALDNADETSSIG